MDSGCSRHMTGQRRWFSSLTPTSGKDYITFGDKGQGKVLGVGSVFVFEKFSLREVAFVQSFGFNFLSVNFSMMGVKCALRMVALVFWMLRESWFVRFCHLPISSKLISLIPLALHVVLLLILPLMSGSGIGGLAI